MRWIARAFVSIWIGFGTAYAGSTIDPTQPAQNSPLSSSVVRNNFGAAYNDINNILGMYPGATFPANPTIGQFHRATNLSPNLIYQWDGGGWRQVSTFDQANGRITPYFGSSLLAWQQLLTGTGGLGTAGQCVTSTGTGTVPTMQNCIAASSFIATAPLAWNSGTFTISLNTDANFSVVSSNLALAAGGIAYPSSVTGGAKGAGTINASGLYINNVAVTAAAITALTGDVTATGPGSAAATLATAQPAVHTWALAQTFTVAPVFTDQSGTRSALGLGTVATQNTGTSGATIPFLNGNNTWAGTNSFGALTATTSFTATGLVTNADLATMVTNTVKGNATAGTASPTDLAVGSCDTATKALQWTTNTGFGCNSSITAAAVPASGLTGTTLAASVVTSSLTTVGALGAGSATTGFTIAASNVTWSGTVPIANLPVGTAAAKGIVQCDGSTITCTAGVITAIGGAATSVTVGTTTVGSGSSGNFLYNNAGVLGERVPATTTNFVAGTANVVLDPASVYVAETTTTYGSTTSFDFNTFYNTKVTLTGNITTVSCSNQKAGQSGAIRFIQDGTGSRTIPATFGCNFKFSGGTQPVLSTAASAIDIMVYSCSATNYCIASLIKAASWLYMPGVFVPRGWPANDNAPMRMTG